MLNQAINILCEPKPFKRHPSYYVFQFSNQRIDTLLLLNTLYEEKELKYVKENKIKNYLIDHLSQG